MKVDRTRFLLLTTALSAATAVGAMATGCTVKNTDKGNTIPGPVTEDSGGGTDGSADASGDGGACLRDDGAEATCAAANASCATACAQYLPNYKKGVARAITECIIKLPTCEGATAEVDACVQSALARACTDSTAVGYCSPIVEGCLGDGGDAGAGALTIGGCTQLATGLNTAGRAAFTSCVTEGRAGYCTASPGSCIDILE